MQGLRVRNPEYVTAGFTGHGKLTLNVCVLHGESGCGKFTLTMHISSFELPCCKGKGFRKCHSWIYWSWNTYSKCCVLHGDSGYGKLTLSMRIFKTPTVLRVVYRVVWMSEWIFNRSGNSCNRSIHTMTIVVYFGRDDVLSV